MNEATETPGALVPVAEEAVGGRAASPVNLFGAEDPAAVVARSTETANALVDVIKQRKLYATIGGRKHILVEGYTLLGSMLGVFPVVVWTKPVFSDGANTVTGWEARVEARTLAGAVVGAAEAECLRSEKTWARRDDYALRSMAQTRAVSKALRGPLGFIVHLAGFAATPAEEMPDIDGTASPRRLSDAQMKKIGAQIRELDKAGASFRPEGHENWTAYAKEWINEQFGKSSRKDLTTAEAGKLIDRLDETLGAMPV